MLLNHFNALGLVGLGVRVKGQVVGYTFGYPISDEVFCVYCEIADKGIKGLPTFLFSTFCQDLAVQKFSYINVMDSFGLDNVAKTKNHFSPAKYLAAYNVTVI